MYRRNRKTANPIRIVLTIVVGRKGDPESWNRGRGPRYVGPGVPACAYTYWNWNQQIQISSDAAFLFKYKMRGLYIFV